MQYVLLAVLGLSLFACSSSPSSPSARHVAQADVVSIEDKVLNDFDTSAYDGEYVSTYGFFKHHQIDLKFSTEQMDAHGIANISVKFSELPEFGICSGKVSVLPSYDIPSSFEIQDLNGLQCTGLIGQKYTWIGFQYAINNNPTLNKTFKGLVFVSKGDVVNNVIFEKVKTKKIK